MRGKSEDGVPSAGEHRIRKPTKPHAFTRRLRRNEAPDDRLAFELLDAENHLFAGEKILDDHFVDHMEPCFVTDITAELFFERIVLFAFTEELVKWARVVE